MVEVLASTKYAVGNINSSGVSICVESAYLVKNVSRMKVADIQKRLQKGLKIKKIESVDMANILCQACGKPYLA